MRVIAGRFRGRLLEPPAGMKTRPITDSVKETLFNILGHRFGSVGGLPCFDVLDVFAGTGSLGIEALSRGARSCVFVERDRAALRGLRTNLERIGLQDSSTVLADNAWSLRPPAVPDGFGLVFVDPPYRDSADPLRMIDLLERLRPGVGPEGLLVLRQEKRYPLPVAELRTLVCVDERTCARMRLLFLKRRESEAEAPGAT